MKSSVHYPMIDGAFLTAPDNAVFDPLNGVFVAENEGVPPDIEVVIDAPAAAEGRDPQLERAVEELSKLVEQRGAPEVRVPVFPRPARAPNQ